jgi:hypothetical protein
LEGIIKHKELGVSLNEHFTKTKKVTASALTTGGSYMIGQEV